MQALRPTANQESRREANSLHILLYLLLLFFSLKIIVQYNVAELRSAPLNPDIPSWYSYLSKIYTRKKKI